MHSRIWENVLTGHEYVTYSNMRLENCFESYIINLKPLPPGESYNSPQCKSLFGLSDIFQKPIFRLAKSSALILRYRVSFKTVGTFFWTFLSSNQ